MKKIKKSIAVFAACLLMSSSVNANEEYFSFCIDYVFNFEEVMGVELTYEHFNTLVERCEAANQ